VPLTVYLSVTLMMIVLLAALIVVLATLIVVLVTMVVVPRVNLSVVVVIAPMIAATAKATAK